MELEGWTNDRLVADRLARLPTDQWVYGVPNASVVMASFLHAAPLGTRFAGPDLGAWYASAATLTAIAEVAHHMRREVVARSVPAMERTYRAYTAKLAGDDFVDLRGLRTKRRSLYALNDYSASQAFGERVRAEGQAGIFYDSVRHRGGENVVVYRPRLITRVTQEAHWRLRVPKVGKIEAQRLSGPER